ncbi:MAG: DinB family protein [Bacteriovoracaceae bacterium]|nr:DinB family protein [Bacteroidota bacterium]
MNEHPLIVALVQQIEESYRAHAWHGTNLRGSIRGLSIEQRCWRPSPKRHNIWEVVVHCAYWKYIVRRRLTGEKQGSFPLQGNNFFKRPVERTDAAWKKDLLLLDEMHELLVEKVSALTPDQLLEYPNSSTFTNLQTISGIAMHDVYHAGQIQLLKRLQK